MSKLSKTKQEILGALDYREPQGAFGLCVGGYAFAFLCRIYGLKYHSAEERAQLRDSIRNGTDKQTADAFETVRNVIEYGVRRHPEYVRDTKSAAGATSAENERLRERIAELEHGYDQLRSHADHLLAKNQQQREALIAVSDDNEHGPGLMITDHTLGLVHEALAGEEGFNG